MRGLRFGGPPGNLAGLALLIVTKPKGVTLRQEACNLCPVYPKVFALFALLGEAPADQRTDREPTIGKDL